MESVLQEIVQAFDNSPVLAGKAARQLAASDRAGFRDAALQMLRGTLAERSQRFLTSVLLGAGLCEEAISESSMLGRDEAIGVARCAASLDPMIEVRLGSRLLSMAEAAESNVNSVRAVLRLLDVLASISEGARLMALAARLARHSHPYIRSKAIKVLGRSNRNPSWARERLSDADVRIRANAIEALWGIEHIEVRPVLEEAAGDPYHRVAGNALIGLYRLGETAALRGITGLSESTDRKRRATGVWAMEQAADARFLPALDRLLKESGNDEPLKRRALAAVESIARREAELNAAPEVRLAAWARGGAGGNHIRLAVSPVQSASQPRIPAVDLRLSQGGFAVLDYTLAELAEEQHRSVAIVVPEGAAGLEKALLECLRFKQRDDSWAIVRYRSKGEASSESVWYVSRAPSVESVIRDTTRAGGGGAARAALRAIRNGQPRQRHLALLVAGEPGSEQPGAAETAELTEMARMTDAAIHTFAPPGCSASVRGWLQELARTCHGSFDEAAGDDLASTLPPACLRCRPRFDVRFSPVERSSFLKLELRSPSARGEVSVPLPR